MASNRISPLVVLWAIALLWSLNHNILVTGDVWLGLLHISSVLSAFILLFFPSSRRALYGAVVTFAIYIAWCFPVVPNHRVLLLLSGATLVISTRSFTHERRAITTLRYLCIVVYCFAFFAKLNTAYLNNTISCASKFFQQSIELHGLATTLWQENPFNTLSTPGVWSAISEIAIVLLLMWSPTRRYGVLFGLAFHCLLATNYLKYFANFSSTLFVLLCAWLDTASLKRLYREKLAYWYPAFLSGALLLYGLLICCSIQVLSPLHFSIIRYLLWTLFAVYILWAVFKSSNRIQHKLQTAGRLPLPFVLMLLPPLILGVSPYLGIRNRNSFSMYSNLQVEPTYSNHLVISKGLDVTGLQSDVATILSVRADSKSDENILLPGSYPYLTICSFLSQMDMAHPTGSIEITFVRNQQNFTFRRGESIPSDCPPWILRKLLLFGRVGDGAERSCVW